MWLMISLLPYRKISIFTPVTTEEAAAMLFKVVLKRPGSWMPSESDVGQFEGVVTSNGFKINRVLSYRNTFVPLLNGKFEAVEGGTRVVMMINLHPFALIWMT